METPTFNRQMTELNSNNSVQINYETIKNQFCLTNRLLGPSRWIDWRGTKTQKGCERALRPGVHSGRGVIGVEINCEKPERLPT